MFALNNTNRVADANQARNRYCLMSKLRHYRKGDNTWLHFRNTSLPWQARLLRFYFHRGQASVLIQAEAR
jgi:hypothetical protein